MNDNILIPLGLLLFIGLFGYAIIRSARAQKKLKSKIFKDFADRHGLNYQEYDDGKVQSFAQGFDGIGRFYSSSLGKVIPLDVVSGKLSGTEVILFRHRTRFYEGWSMEWFVVGITQVEPMVDQCTIQFCRSRLDKTTIYLEDPIVKELKRGLFNLVVRSSNSLSASKFMESKVPEALSGFAESLPFRPEIQIRGKRMVVYLADRNATIDNIDDLEYLADFARKAGEVISGKLAL